MEAAQPSPASNKLKIRSRVKHSVNNEQNIANVHLIYAFLFALILYAASATRAQAINFIAFDPRTMAMGGAGIAIAKPYNAMVFNPARLNSEDSDKVKWFVRPYIGARLIDRDNFIDNLERFQDSDSEGQLNAAIKQFESTLNQDIDSLDDITNFLSSTRSVTNSARSVLSDYQSLSQRPLRVSAGTGIVYGRADDNQGWGVIHRQFWAGGSLINFTAKDSNRINRLLDTADQLTDGVEFLLDNSLPQPLILALLGILVQGIDIPTVDSLSSTLIFQGAEVTESGIGYATRLSNHSDWSIGVSLKQVQFTTVDYEERITSAETFDFSDTRNRRSYSDLNFDFGISLDINEQWRTGIVVKNLISYDYLTVLGNEIKLSPLVRTGVAFSGESYMLTADLDLTKNDPLGFDPDKRYLALGGEWPLTKNTSLRVGYRINTVNNNGLWSIGMGIGPEWLHLDFAVAAHKDELGAALQLGITF